jgi:hypothetical protein
MEVDWISGSSEVDGNLGEMSEKFWGNLQRERSGESSEFPGSAREAYRA